MCILNSQLNSIPLFPCRMPCTISSRGHTLCDREKTVHLRPKHTWAGATQDGNSENGQVFSEMCSSFAWHMKAFRKEVGENYKHTHTHTHTHMHTQGKTFHLSLGSISDLCRSTERASRSVTSNSLGPHGLKPTRLFCPWNFPGKNTGVDGHSHLQGIFLTQTL